MGESELRPLHVRLKRFLTIFTSRRLAGVPLVMPFEKVDIAARKAEFARQAEFLATREAGE